MRLTLTLLWREVSMSFTGYNQGSQVTGYAPAENAGIPTQFGAGIGTGAGAGAAALPVVAAAAGPAAPFVLAAAPVIGGAIGALFGSYFEDDPDPIVTEMPPPPPAIVPSFGGSQYLIQPPQLPSLVQDYGVGDPLGFTQDPYGIG